MLMSCRRSWTGYDGGDVDERHGRLLHQGMAAREEGDRVRTQLSLLRDRDRDRSRGS